MATAEEKKKKGNGMRLEIAKLFRAYHSTGNITCRNQLVEEHMGLVYRAARKHCYKWQNFRDVVQVGCVALINAVEHYDPDREVTFSTYAVPSIEGEIKRYFRDKVATS